MERTEYIGDGVYAEYTEIGIKLSTLRHDLLTGKCVTHYIYMDPSTIDNLLHFKEYCEQKK